VQPGRSHFTQKMYRLCLDVSTGFCGLFHVRPHKHIRSTSSMFPRAARSLPLLLALVAGGSQALELSCKVGASRCIKSQGKEISSKKAIELLDTCGEFIANDIGRITIRMSQKEMLDRSGGKATPLARAWFAYGDLIDSPLKFERKAKAEEASYAEIKRACLQLERDFNDDSKWTK
jgi:hypothetical protein